MLDRFQAIKPDKQWVKLHNELMYTKKNANVITIATRIIDAPLLNVLTVLSAVDLYSKWVPFCTESKVLQQVSKLRQLNEISFKLN